MRLREWLGTVVTVLHALRLALRAWRRIRDRRVRAAIIRKLSAACTDDAAIETDHWARIGWELGVFVPGERR